MNTALSLELIVVAGLIAFFLLVRATLSVEKPNPAQQIAEVVHEFVGDQAGPDHRSRLREVPILCHLHLSLVILNNLLGLIPGVVTPTSAPFVPLGIALLTFIYYHYYGFKEQGFVGYMKHFAGPIWWIAWLLFPIEIISHFARNHVAHHSSLCQHVASDLVTLVFFFTVPARHSCCVSWIARRGVGDPGLRVHASSDDLSVTGGLARTLMIPILSSKTRKNCRRSLPLRINERPPA